MTEGTPGRGHRAGDAGGVVPGPAGKGTSRRVAREGPQGGGTRQRMLRGRGTPGGGGARKVASKKGARAGSPGWARRGEGSGE